MSDVNTESHFNRLSVDEYVKFLDAAKQLHDMGFFTHLDETYLAQCLYNKSRKQHED